MNDPSDFCDAPWIYAADLRVGDVPLNEAETRHALGSRRLRPGDVVTLFDGRGHVARATLLPRASVAAQSKPAARQALARVEAVTTLNPPAHALTLIAPGCKGDRLDWLVEKCTELGVTRLLLAEYERSIVHVGETRLEKLRRAALEACKQCRRPWLPQIDAAGALATALRSLPDLRLLIAHPDPDAVALGPWLNDHLPTTTTLAIVIGPEGGLSEDELQLLRAAGGQVVRLAEHVLRVETSAVAAAAAWAATALGRSG